MGGSVEGEFTCADVAHPPLEGSQPSATLKYVFEMFYYNQYLKLAKFKPVQLTLGILTSAFQTLEAVFYLLEDTACSVLFWEMNSKYTGI
jgi:hypothetical protein